MDRAQWLAERRAAVAASYDAEASKYDELDYPHDAQREWVARVLGAIPPNSLVLDAPCGTGRYFPLVAGAGHRVVGIDQSAGMLAESRTRGIAADLQHVGLQELAFADAFDAVLTIDAMENVAPEDWPRVLGNLRRAAKPGGLLYLTVEEVDEAVVDGAIATLAAAGLPAVRGEVVEGDVASYHYYPGRERVLDWLRAATLDVVDEGYRQDADDWGYRHFLLRRPAAG